MEEGAAGVSSLFGPTFTATNANAALPMGVGRRFNCIQGRVSLGVWDNGWGANALHHQQQRPGDLCQREIAKAELRLLVFTVGHDGFDGAGQRQQQAGFPARRRFGG